jgi:hypothetical protein
VQRLAAETGRLAWAAPQDWMVEPAMLARTGLSVAEHQARTVDGFCRLSTQLAPGLPVIPVLQGQTVEDYITCVTRYADSGVDLTRVPLVGLGSVCRRQASDQITQVVRELAAGGLRLHGFGVKTGGLARYAGQLVSADSLAWSYDHRRRRAPLPGCQGHRNCANCPRAALAWRTRVLTQLRGDPR